MRLDDPIAEINRLKEENQKLRWRNEELEQELGKDVFVPSFLKLTRKEEAIFRVLVKRENPSYQTFLNAMYSDLDKEPETDKIVKVFMTKLRRKLKKYNVEILTHVNHGYFLPKEDRARALALISPEAK